MVIEVFPAPVGPAMMQVKGCLNLIVHS